MLANLEFDWQLNKRGIGMQHRDRLSCHWGYILPTCLDVYFYEVCLLNVRVRVNY